MNWTILERNLLNRKQHIWHMNNVKSITDFDGLDLEFVICTDLLKLNSLHYGYWFPDEAITLPNGRIAQKRYTTTLLELIPKGVKKILDVGCGMGDVSRTLEENGYYVTAISPDKNHPQYFHNNGKNLDFIQSRFENLESNEKFDLILMSESQNYFDTDIGFQKCQELLTPNGYLLVSGMFRKTDEKSWKEVINIKENYLRTADKCGLKLITEIDITQQILPTLVFFQRLFQEYGLPTSKIFDHFVHTSAPFKAKLLKFFFQKQLNELKRIYHYYIRRTTPAYFCEHIEYLRLLFQRV